MKLETFHWSKVSLTFKDTGEVINYKIANLMVRDNTLGINAIEYKSDFSNGPLLAHPKLISLTSFSCEFKAKWWSSKAVYDEGSAVPRFEKVVYRDVIVKAEF